MLRFILNKYISIINYFHHGWRTQKQYENDEKKEHIQRLIDLNGHEVMKGILRMSKDPSNNKIVVKDIDGQYYTLKGYKLIRRYNRLTQKHEIVVVEN